MKNNISVVINTFNEEKNIRNCLESVKWADECIVVDMHSDDRTVAIAQEYTSIIFMHERIGYVEPARKFAVEKTSNEWVLIIDADEMVPKKLKDFLINIAVSDQVDVVLIPRENYFWGHLMQATGWSALQDMQLRFFKKSFIIFDDKIHSRPKLRPGYRGYTITDESCGFTHFNYLTPEHFIEKLNKYTTIEARNRFERGEKFSENKFFAEAHNEVMSRRNAGKGIQADGFHGQYLSAIMGMYRLTTGIKLKLLEQYDNQVVEECIRQEYAQIASGIIQEYKDEETSIPAVAIGMPVYNGAKYIHQTITSLLNQTFTDFKIIICDDGSTDETVALCREFATLDSRVQVVVNEERLGGAKNFNRAFELSNGKYFMWASQDDLFHPTYIEKCLAKIEVSPQAVMALTEIVFIDENGNRAKVDSPNDINIGTEGMNVVQRLQEVFKRTGWWAIYGLIRPEILRKTKMYRNEFGGDVILIAELLLHGEFAKIVEPLFYYRVRTQKSFTIAHNMQSIDHTQTPSKAAYTDLMRSIVRCVVEFDLEPMIKNQIIISMANTLAAHNQPICNNILQENAAHLIALAVSTDQLHQITLDQIDKKSQG